MAGELNHKIAVVTGAGGGIGRASAVLFGSAGATVVCVDINSDSADRTAAAVTEAGGAAHAVSGDLTAADAVRLVFEQIDAHFGGTDILLHVAGGSGRRLGDGPVAECTEEGWDFVIDLNLKSTYLCCKYAVQSMLRRGAGSIVNLSSVLALVGGDADFGTHAYAASKGGIVSLTRAIASYYAPDGIRANVICPGLVETPMSARAQRDPRILDRLPQLHPLTGRMGAPEDVANAALFLASDSASFITGAVLTVDGGWTVR